MYSNVNKISHFSYFDPDYPTYELTVIGSTRVYVIHQPFYGLTLRSHEILTESLSGGQRSKMKQA
jgi:hypothetical protein